MPQSYVRQAREQLEHTKADAALIFYSGPISATERITCDQGQRLVCVGNYRNPGQVCAGVMQAVLIGTIEVMLRGDRMAGGGGGLLLSSQDVSRFKSLMSCLGRMLGAVRRAQQTLQTSIKNSVRDQGIMATEFTALLGEGGTAASALFPADFLNMIRMKFESLDSGSRGSGNKRKKPLVATSSDFASI